MKIIGLILIAIGIFALVNRGSVNYTQKEKVVDLGRVEGAVDQNKRVYLGPVAGTISILAGVALLAVGKKRDRDRILK